MENTWDTSDFRVLEAIVEIPDSEGTDSVTAARIMISVGTGADSTSVHS